MSAAHRVEILPKEPVLILDPLSQLGKLLALKLRNEFAVILASKALHAVAGTHHVILKEHGSHLPDAQYAYIIVFYSGEQYLLSMLPIIAQKAGTAGARLLCIVPVQLATDATLTQIKEISSKIYIVVTGDIFGTADGVSEKSIIDDFLFNAKHKHHVILSEQGILPLYPVDIIDVLEGIVRILFSVYKQKAALFLFPQIPLTELSFMRLLQRLEPLLQIDFSSDVPNRQVVLPLGEYVFTKKYPLTEKLRFAYGLVLPAPTPGHISEEKKEKRKSVFSRRIFFFSPKYIMFSLLAIVVAMPIILSLLLSLFGFIGIYLLQKDLTSKTVGQVYSEAMFSRGAFFLAKQSLSITQAELYVIGQQNLLQSYGNLLTTVEAGTNVITAATGLMSPYQDTKKITKEEFLRHLSALKTSLDTLTNLKTAGELSPAIENIFNQNQAAGNFISNTSDSYAQLFGFNKKQTYLMLFQNNMEIRPTGGFIGSYGVMSMENGRMTDFAIHDVYDADGQLKEHIEPPYPIRRYIPMVHWYMRDSNFDPDFPTSASVAANFLFKETGTKADGVIGVDLTFVKNILSSLGSVYLPNYHETVTPDSLFLQAETHAEKQFFPGSAQKQNFLKALFMAMQERFNEKKNISYQVLAHSFAESLLSKDIIFAFADSGAQSLFSANGYADSLTDTRSAATNKINDFFVFNEANIGANKVNYYMRRKISQQVQITGNGNIAETIDIYYLNTSENSWPGGSYKNYVRLIVPQNTVLTGVSINGQKQVLVPAITDFGTYEAKNFTSPAGLEVAKSSEFGKNTFGFLLDIPPTEYKHITITYTLGATIDLTKPEFFYAGKIIKQPGMPADPFSFSLQTPQGYNVLQQGGTTNVASKEFHLTADTDFSYHLVKQ